MNEYVRPNVDVFLQNVAPRQKSASLFGQLRTAIVTGRFRVGDRLPTTRDLAADLAVSRSTVTAVYGRLTAEGYAEGRGRAGTFVADIGQGSHRPGHDRKGHTTIQPAVEFVDTHVADLRSGRPDPRLFPVVPWRRAVTAALQAAPPDYGDPAGLIELRRTIASWVRRSRGVNAEPDNVMITAGAQGAFDVIARILAATGDSVAIENPGYAPARHAFESAGLHIRPTPVDADGVIVNAIEPGTSAVYVTPSHQAPTGAVMSPARRIELLARCADDDIVVIEDDYDTEYRYVDRPLEPLHLLDTEGRVIYVGSFSKTLTPSLRLGFIVADHSTVRRLAEGRRVIDVQPPHLTQAGLAEFIASGRFDSHLRRVGREYRRRREYVIERTAQWYADRLIDRIPECPAGLHTMVDLSSDVDAEDIAARTCRQGVAVHTTADSWVGSNPSQLIIGFGAAPLSNLESGLGVIERELRRS